jgi:hypothetical protein
MPWNDEADRAIEYCLNIDVAMPAAPAGVTWNQHSSGSVSGAQATYAITSFVAGTNVVIFGERNIAAETINSVTINGVSATRIAAASSGTGGAMYTDMWYATGVPSGAGDIVANWSVAPNVTSCQLYTLSTTTPAPSTSAGNTSFAGTTDSVTLTVPTNGVAIVCVSEQDGLTITSWTNASGDDSFSPNNTIASAHTTTTGLLTITATFTGNTDWFAISAAAWGP